MRMPFLKLSPSQCKVFVEGVGTFIWVMTVFLAECNCGKLAIDGITHTRNLAPIAEGFMLSVMVCAFGYISGGHFNPAVTVAILLIKQIRVDLAIMYIMAQCIGALLGAIVGLAIQGTGGILPAPQVYLNLPEYVARGFAGEAIFTGAIVTVVLHVTCSTQRSNHYYGLAIGMIYMSAVYAVGGVSGGSFNPAMASALQICKCVSGYCLPLMHMWLYWAAPCAGAVGAALLFKMTHPPPVSEQIRPTGAEAVSYR